MSNEDKAGTRTSTAEAAEAADSKSHKESAKDRAKEGAKQVADGTRKILQSVGDGLMAAGHAAEKLTRKGVHAVEIEKMRIDLRHAYSRLGEAACKLWDVTPGAAVTMETPEVQPALKEVADIKKRIKETEEKIEALKK